MDNVQITTNQLQVPINEKRVPQLIEIDDFTHVQITNCKIDYLYDIYIVYTIIK